MCTCRREDDTSTTVEMTETTGLKGGASCSHRNKKSLLKAKDYRKKLKSPKRSCEECDRLLEKNQAVPENVTDEILLCMSCNKMICEDHAKKHCEAVKTGDPHVFLLQLNKGILRCHPCDVDLEPLDDPEDPVKQFYNNYNSYKKTKNEADEKKKEAKEEEKAAKSEAGKVKTNGTAIKAVERSNSKTRDNSERLNMENGVAKTSPTKQLEDMDTLIPAKGLANLGNTCFFNSVMQCIMHTHHLDFYFRRFGQVEHLTFTEPKTVTLSEEKINLEPVTMKVPMESSLLNNVVKCHISEFRHGQSPSPRPVFTEISTKAPRFKGYQQQDAHELLRYLLDGLRSEEQERYKSAIATYVNVPKDKVPKNTDPALMKKAKGYLQAAGRPLLDAVFGGTLLQTIRCCECNHVSQAFEQFLDLSVPMSSNPMSAAGRAAAGARTPSAHQKKKAEKAAKKGAKKAKRKTAETKKCDSSSKDAPVIDAIEDMNLSEEESEITDEEEEVEDDRLVSGGVNIAADHLDMTKVLVEAPVEYHKSSTVGACLLEFTGEELLTDTNAYECERCCQPRNKKLDAKGSAKKRVDAIKRYLIYEPPAVLTLQLKRFQQVQGYTGRLSTRKLGGHVEFPLIFDIAPFCCKNVQRVVPGQKQLFYSLYGVVVHSGDLGGGHYIAYVKSRHRVPQARDFLEAARSSCVDAMRCPSQVDLSISTVRANSEPKSPDGQWYFCSDSSVRAVPETQVLNSEAYILFYERLS